MALRLEADARERARRNLDFDPMALYDRMADMGSSPQENFQRAPGPRQAEMAGYQGGVMPVSLLEPRWRGASSSTPCATGITASADAVQHLWSSSVSQGMRVLGIAAVGWCLFLPLAAQTGWVYGCVLDEEGFLMEDVTVKSAGADMSRSNADGKYDVMASDSVLLALTFSAPGYADKVFNARPHTPRNAAQC